MVCTDSLCEFLLLLNNPRGSKLASDEAHIKRSLPLFLDMFVDTVGYLRVGDLCSMLLIHLSEQQGWYSAGADKCMPSTFI